MNLNRGERTGRKILKCQPESRKGIKERTASSVLSSKKKCGRKVKKQREEGSEGEAISKKKMGLVGRGPTKKSAGRTREGEKQAGVHTSIGRGGGAIREGEGTQSKNERLSGGWGPKKMRVTRCLRG